MNMNHVARKGSVASLAVVGNNLTPLWSITERRFGMKPKCQGPCFWWQRWWNDSHKRRASEIYFVGSGTWVKSFVAWPTTPDKVDRGIGLSKLRPFMEWHKWQEGNERWMLWSSWLSLPLSEPFLSDFRWQRTGKKVIFIKPANGGAESLKPSHGLIGALLIWVN